MDTNILSDLIRHPQGMVAQRIGVVGEAAVCTSIMVACELRFGAAKKSSPRLTKQVNVVIAAMDVLPYDAPADQTYAAIRQHLAACGQPIGPNDLFIASHALALYAIWVSANVDEFSRVPGLTVHNWLH
ncbi:type II toxin-antitoxin system VapC family toxin [Acidithiobacillus ferrooxidans]|uniref:type II toxin-antitoxin system VapC family toxin n=1 Tax=Acidithiobacillus ferrooxidans TaxID=920 RepID=UPI001C069ED4|nr:type II toxin-antitoxin system VapC family toxin [Acidithiobacillus ferrooxidans]MBU2858506.1 type II toxin-antitoxin system VapC family toxin [Acidithiobacillus ferrooxidans]MBU2861250.1 type II toxin-antitoxin system VapC family toxin [Acidithiobacillus ferrooxidans]